MDGSLGLGANYPAARIDGNEFVLAAQRYGLGTDMAAMNRMVGLVNNGYSVDAAAQAVSGKTASLLPQPTPMPQPAQGVGLLGAPPKAQAF